MKEYADLLKEFKEWVQTDSEVKALWELNRTGKASYIDAEKYSKLVSEKWSAMLVDAYGEANYKEVVEDVANAYKKAYSESAYYSKEVQTNINEEAGINLKGKEPAIDEARITNMMKKLVGDDASFLLKKSAIENVSKAAIVDTIKTNARLHNEAGLENYVVRDARGGCCDWCKSISGKYAWGKQPSDFWRVHKDCTCLFEYKVNKTHTKISYNSKRKITEKVVPKQYENVVDVTKDFLKNRKAGTGVLEFFNETDEQGLKDRATAKWLYDLFGGNIQVLPAESQKGKNPDSLWNGKYWEFKQPSSETSVNDRIRHGSKQIREASEREGIQIEGAGLVVDISNRKMSYQDMIDCVVEKATKRMPTDTYVMIKDKETLIKIFKIKK